MAVLDDSMIYKRVFIQRLLQYESDPVRGAINECNSPIFDMIRISEIFGVFTDVKGMLNGTKSYSKHQWKDKIWKRAWDIEDQDRAYRTSLLKSTINLRKINGRCASSNMVAAW